MAPAAVPWLLALAVSPAGPATHFEAERAGMVRVVDESGEGYVYPKAFFAEIKVPPGLAKALAART